jgi:hypothetical protein
MTTTLTATGPEDLLAAVPLVLGFHPEDSLVMLTFGPPRTFHARVDLPPTLGTSVVQELVETLLGPTLTHSVREVAFMVYSRDASLTAGLAAELVPAFVAEGVGVLGVFRADEGMWCEVPIRRGGSESPPAPYDARHHRFTAQAVVEGRVTHASRAELRDTLARDDARRDRWAAEAAALPPSRIDAGDVVALVMRCVESGLTPDDSAAACILSAITRVEVRDAAVHAISCDLADQHLRVWSALLCGAADEQVPDVAAVTALCAWLSGDGALAWCALDRCFAVDPAHRLGRCVAECLSGAVPPAAWEDGKRA